MFDEDNAIKYIRTSCGNMTDCLSDDDILFVIDCIWDYYDEKEMLDIDFDADDDNIEIRTLLEYVTKAIRKDGQIEVTPEILKGIIIKEMEYEQSVEEDF